LEGGWVIGRNTTSILNRKNAHERPNNAFISNRKLPQELRQHATDAERLLWRHLRDRQMNGCKFRRQHPYENFILDFVSLEARLVIELDGGQHAEATEADIRRDALLRAAGFRVLRFWNNQMLAETDSVLEAIRIALGEQGCEGV
jgi:very-short-patch-repair endonuclease